ncbi:MAG TPA: O-antigen ligase family protein [Bauldia sp.]|nr:O-antigen ligase family protein [Bauldia sp.]
MAKASRLLFYALIVWEPLPLASNRPLLWALNGVAAAMILALFLLGERGKSARSEIDWQPVALASAAFAVVVLWMVVQALPGIPAALRHPAWSAVAGAAGAISISPSDTWTTLAEILPIVLAGILAARLGMDRRRARFLVSLVVAVTAAVAAYGLLADAAGFPQVFLVDTVAYPGAVTGTFIGRNAAATYFVIGIACATAMVAGRAEAITTRADAPERHWSLSAIDVARGSAFYLLADFILAAALLNTGSRGGTIAAAIALIAVILLSLWRTSGSRATLAATIVATLGAAFIVVAVFSDFLLARLARGLGTEDRLAAYADTLDMIRDRPLLGQGGGTFIDAFPLYHLRATSLYLWDRAHDTYLQAAAELGLPAFAVLVAGLVVLVVAVVRGALRKGETHPAAVAAVAVAAATAFHSLVDFSLQVQAVGLTAAVVMGAGLGESVRRAKAGRSRRTPTTAAIAASVNHRETINVTIPTAAGKSATAAS